MHKWRYLDVNKYIPEKSFYSEWDPDNLKKDIETNLGISIPADKWVKEDGIVEREINERINSLSKTYMAQRVSGIGAEIFREAEKSILLQVLDQSWKDHLLYLDQLRQSIGLRAYGQKDPLNEYKREAFILFEEMLSKIGFTVVSILSNFEIKKEPIDSRKKNMDILKKEGSNKIPRNAKCPCGSGKKYKHCCGKI